MKQEPKVFVVKLRPGGGALEECKKQGKEKEWKLGVCDFCKKNHIIGIGWSIKENRIINDFEYYKKRFMSSYEKKQFINIQHLHECKEGDIIITRHIDGTYYIGKVNRPWKYIGKKKYEYYDVVNNVGMIWYKVKWGRLGLPGDLGISSSFGNIVIPKTDEIIKEAIKISYNISSGKNYFKINEKIKEKLYGKNALKYLDPRDLEDFIGLYLQIKFNYKILPSTWTQSEKDYEFYASKVEGKNKYESIAVQVKKSGELDINKYEKSADKNQLDKVFLYSGEYNYRNKRNAKKTKIIEENDLINFMKENRKLIDKTIPIYKLFSTTK